MLVSVVMDAVNVDLAHAINATIVVYVVQLASPIQVLLALRLVELNLERKGQNLAILELEHQLNLSASLVLVHLEPVSRPIEHVD